MVKSHQGMKRSKNLKSKRAKEIITNDLGERIHRYKLHVHSVHLNSCKGTTKSVEQLKARIRFNPGEALQEYQTKISNGPFGKNVIMPHLWYINLNPNIYYGAAQLNKYYNYYNIHDDRMKATAIEHAAALGHTECCRVLIEMAGHKEGVTERALINGALFRQIKTYDECVSVTKVLTKYGKFPLDSKNLILHCIRTDPDTELLKMILENRIAPQGINASKKLAEENYFLLTEVFRKHNFDVAILLLLNGAPLNRPRVTNYQSFCIPHDFLYTFDDSSDLLRALNIYKMFGGNLWYQKYRIGRQKEPTLLKELEASRSPQVSRHLKVVAEIQEMATTPLSLLDLSRLSIKKAMGRNLSKHAKELPLPTYLKQYLNFSDLKATVPIVNTQPSTSSST